MVQIRMKSVTIRTPIATNRNTPHQGVHVRPQVHPSTENPPIQTTQGIQVTPHTNTRTNTRTNKAPLSPPRPPGPGEETFRTTPGTDSLPLPPPTRREVPSHPKHTRYPPPEMGVTTTRLMPRTHNRMLGIHPMPRTLTHAQHTRKHTLPTTTPNILHSLLNLLLEEALIMATPHNTPDILPGDRILPRTTTTTIRCRP